MVAFKRKHMSDDSDSDSDFEAQHVSESEEEDVEDGVEESEDDAEEEEKPKKKASKKKSSAESSDGDESPKKKGKATRSKKGKWKRSRRSRGSSKKYQKLDNYEWDEHDAEGLSEVVHVPVEATPPDGLRVNLLPFQRESLNWMTNQEQNSEIKGGILADDMGMGKTLQTIALILKSKSEGHIGATLVVCPVVALVQWHTEILKYIVADGLTVLLYHGPERLIEATQENIEKVQSYDVVLTTYAIVESDFRFQNNGRKRKEGVVKKPSLLHNSKWQRVVLDEAHSIKDRQCATARAVFALNSAVRWSLTGTPLQNRVGELYSLVRFLQVTPFSYYYCKKCPCKSLTWKFPRKNENRDKFDKDGKKRDRRHHQGARACEDCGHSPMSHFAWWNRNVLNPIMRHGMESVEGQTSMRNLKCILQRIMLRRTKQEKADDLCLPPRAIRYRRVELDDEENDFYEALYGQSKTRFQGYVEEGTILNNYAHVFDLLLRLRQAVCHPYLVLHRKAEDGAKVGPGACCICFEPAEDAITSQCEHVFCRLCATEYIESDESAVHSCPSCKRALTINLAQEAYIPPKKVKNENILQRVDLANWRSSSKVEALVEELTRTRMRDPNAKSLVFSQFVNFLDLIEWRLKLSGFKCVKLDGRMTMQAKNIAIQQFHDDPDTCVFLISLKAGGQALNLTIASYCYLMDPWWNPAAEFQAIDRIYRLGQYKSINVTRFIIPNTIEDRITRLQDKKLLVFQSTVGMDADALARLSVDDLKFLFM